MNTIHRDSGSGRRRAITLAAAVAVAVVLAGAAAIALSATGDEGEVIAANTQPAETVLAAPTTSPPTTVARTTTPPPTTVPPTTLPPTTVPAPQVYDATLTWDGETCTFDGPTEARVGDSLIVTGINTSARDVWPQLHYLRSDATIENVDSYFDNELGNFLAYGVTPGWTWYDDELLGYLHPPQHLGMITVFDTSIEANSTTEVLGANTQSDPAWRLRIPREYLFVCAEMIDVQGKTFQEQRLSDRIIDNASQTIRVTE